MPVSLADTNIGYNLNGRIFRRKNFSFALNTTYGCGGEARIAYFPDSVPAAKRAYDLASRGRFIILGNGSNVLAADGFYDGSVISAKNFSGIYRVSDGVLCCLAGTKISKILDFCLRNRLGGLEYLYGIPATIGGAAFMNAGASGRFINENVIKVRVYDGRQYDLSLENCNFSYKHSTMRDINAIILSVYLKVQPERDKNLIINELLRFKDLRKNLPKGKSCGCVFKNIDGLSAGKLIQNCNLANYSVGLARVSEKHCNFIINEGASSSDVKKLIDIVKKKVYEKTSRKLDEEVIYIGDFNDSYS